MKFRRMLCCRVFFFFIIVVNLFSLSYGKDIKVTAYVDRKEITIRDIITLTIEIEGATDFPRVPKPEAPDFFVVSGPSQSSSIQIINGAVSASKSLKWRMAPSKTGKLVINPISVKYGRKIYKTEPISIVVSDKDTGFPLQKQQRKVPTQKGPTVRQGEVAQNLFLKATSSKNVAYKGEEIDISFNLYYNNVDIRSFSRKKFPDAQGFWMEEFPAVNNPHVTTEIVNGVRYRKANLQRIAFFPTTSGELTIDPMIITCEVIIPQKRRRSLFDEFFDDGFFSSPFFEKTAIKEVPSQPIQITVKPLPEEGRPSDFAGIVGKYFLVSSIDTLETTQDQALTLKYVIKGTGNIEALTLPSPNFPSTVEVFEPKIERKVNNKGKRIQGSASYEYVLIPRRSGDISIPALSISYFDSDIKKYRRIFSKSFKVKIHPSERMFATPGVGMSKEEISLLGEDIRFISRESKLWHKRGSSIFFEVWFWLVNTLSIIIVVGSVGFRWWTDKLEANLAFARRRRAWSSAQNKLRLAESVQKSEEKKEFFTYLDNALVGYISDRLGLPTSGIGLQDIEKELKDKRVTDEIINNVSEVLNYLYRARFSPESLSDTTERSIMERSKKIISQLSKTI